MTDQELAELSDLGRQSRERELTATEAERLGRLRHMVMTDTEHLLDQGRAKRGRPTPRGSSSSVRKPSDTRPKALKDLIRFKGSRRR